MGSKICLSLTCSTLKEDLALYEHYIKFFPAIEMLELRVDMLNSDEVFYVHKFPSLVSLPVVLTIRRERDGGQFKGGEYARAVAFSRCLNVREEGEKTFAYIDLEDDFFVSELEDVCDILKIKIVRSHHSISEPILDYTPIIEQIKTQKRDVIKIASMSSCLADTKKLFEARESLKNEEHVLVAMGEYGFVSRILAVKLDNAWVYTFAHTEIKRLGLTGKMISPETLIQHYNFFAIRKESHLFGIIGGSVNTTLSPPHHNRVFREEGLPCAYVPLCAKNVEEALDMAHFLEIKALSVTAPFKIVAMQYATEIDESARIVGSCNTLSFLPCACDEKVVAYNEDVWGFERALKEFLGGDFAPSLKVCLLGAGGASRAVCHVLGKNGFKDVTVFNRTYAKAEELALGYGYKAAFLDSSSVGALMQGADLIINATSLGKLENDGGKTDILPFYRFSGKEKVFDLVYDSSNNSRALSPLLQRAENAGCKICDGSLMFLYQAMEQERIFKSVLKTIM